ncbi:hypothetical protein ACJX0J_032604, partial [Zea mays]
SDHSNTYNLWNYYILKQIKRYTIDSGKINIALALYFILIKHILSKRSGALQDGPTAVFGAVINGYCQMGRMEDAARLLNEMTLVPDVEESNGDKGLFFSELDTMPLN